LLTASNQVIPASHVSHEADQEMFQMTHKKMLRSTTAMAAATLTLSLAMAMSSRAQAQTATEQKPAAEAAPVPAAAAPPPGYYVNGIRLGAQFQGGFYGNADSPSSGINVGQSFTDRSNSILLNQALFTVEKAVDKTATDYQFGFKIQAMYGTDARYTHFLNELSNVTSQRTQLDLVEASVSAHTPWLTSGGMDFKVGQFPTLLGFETIDPSTNPFYSHSYIFNYSLPFKHTGALAITHVIPELDVYLQIDTGNQTSFGFPPGGDNNGAIAGMAGVGSTLMDGNLTLLALSHFGPEQAGLLVGGAANSNYRYYNDALATYKINEKLSITTEVSWVHDELGLNLNGQKGADAYGVAQYVTYALTDTIALNARAEIFRDQNNFFVGNFTNSLGPVQALGGKGPATLLAAAQTGTTYGAITLGFTYKPVVPDVITNLMIRPEIRYDDSLSGGKPFADQTKSYAFFFGADVVLGF
jgi:hypothetical protein